MNKLPNNRRNASARLAFTLIELLVVIAIIAVLAAMVFPITGAVNKAKIRSKTRVEVDQVVTFIESYKAKLGHYPPDNPDTNYPFRSPLYYELVGAKVTAPDTYTTLDGSSPLVNKADLLDVFSVQGFVNCSRGSGDEGPVAANFARSLKPNQVGNLTNSFNKVVKLLVCTVLWPPSAPGPFSGMNPFRYNSSAPRHNRDGYDLWVDVIIAGKTNRFSNWSKTPEIVNTIY
jgi:prepilin-type N-terminal cleavage/methylation domain-containing protein